LISTKATNVNSNLERGRTIRTVLTILTVLTVLTILTIRTIQRRKPCSLISTKATNVNSNLERGRTISAVLTILTVLSVLTIRTIQRQKPSSLISIKAVLDCKLERGRAVSTVLTVSTTDASEPHRVVPSRTFARLHFDPNNRSSPFIKTELKSFWRSGRSGHARQGQNNCENRGDELGLFLHELELSVGCGQELLNVSK
jgi:hypothetical protein